MPAAPALSRRPIGSPYMEWAKTQAAARFNLAGSGVAAVSPGEFGPVEAEGAGELTGPSFYGWPPLQEALGQFLNAPTECIVHTTGASLANHLALAVLADPGDTLLLEEPTYGLLAETASFLGLEVRRFDRGPLQGRVSDLAELEARFTPRTRIIALTNLHNPTSAALDGAGLRLLARFAADRGAWLLVDEVYRDAAFEAAPPSGWTVGENVVVTGSLTKAYGLGGLRCGWLVGAKRVAVAAARLNDLVTVIPAHPAERLAVAALGRITELRERSRRLLTANQVRFNAFLGGHPGLDCAPVSAGTVAFPRLREGSVEALVSGLRIRYETSVVPGHFFGRSAHFRIGLGGMTADFAAGLERLDAALGAGLHQ